MRVLLAEDDWTSRQVLLRALERWGHDVTIAVDGEDALKAHTEDPFPLILTDWVMPRMSGIDLCRAVRGQSRPEYTYIIILTARDDQASLLQAFEAGVDDFLPKPFDPAELLARMRVGERVLGLEGELLRRMDQLARANGRMRRDLEAAARIQRGLLPDKPLDIASIGFAWKLRPCDELAGDIFNFARIDDRHVALYLLDVSGHGVGSALLSVTVSRFLAPSHGQSLITATNPSTGAEEAAPPRLVLERLNARFQLTESAASQFFTIIYALLDTRTGRLTWANAGHPPAIHTSPAGVPLRLESRNLPIGFLPDVEYTQESRQLVPGDRVVLFSDGIIEAVGDRGEQFEANRAESELAARAAAPLATMVDGLVDAVEAWTNGHYEDDISILALEWRGP